VDSQQQRDHTDENWQREELRREGEAELAADGAEAARAAARKPADHAQLTVGELTLVLNALNVMAIKARGLDLAYRKDAVWARHTNDPAEAERHEEMAVIARQTAREHEELRLKLQPTR
jgi:hypothetical protein